MDCPDDADDEPEFPVMMLFPVITWAAHAVIVLGLQVWFSLLAIEKAGWLGIGFSAIVLTVLGPLICMLARGSYAIAHGKWDAVLCFASTIPVMLLMLLAFVVSSPYENLSAVSVFTLFLSNMIFLAAFEPWRRWARNRNHQSL